MQPVVAQENTLQQIALGAVADEGFGIFEGCALAVGQVNDQAARTVMVLQAKATDVLVAAYGQRCGLIQKFGGLWP